MQSWINTLSEYVQTPQYNNIGFQRAIDHMIIELPIHVTRRPLPTKDQWNIGKKTKNILKQFGINKSTYGSFVFNVKNLKHMAQAIVSWDDDVHYLEVERKMQNYIDTHTNLLWFCMLSHHLSSQQKKYFRKIRKNIIKDKKGDVWGATARKFPKFIWDKIALIGITQSNIRHYTKNTKETDWESMLEILSYRHQPLQVEIKQQLIQYMKFLQSGTQQQVEEEALRLEASVCGETEMQPWKKSKSIIMKFKRAQDRLKTKWNKNIKTKIYKNKKSVVTTHDTEASMITKRVSEDERGMWQPPWEDYEDLITPPIKVVPEWGALPKGMFRCDFSEDIITICQEPKTPTVPEKPSVVAKGRELVVVRDVLKIA